MHTVHVSLDRQHLQLLGALFEFGRLGDAARSLHLSASAASHRLAQAERRLGVPLTTQHGRTIRLTEAGRHLAFAARDIERDVERAELTARWIGGGGPVRLRVAVGFFDTASWLVDTFESVDGTARTELLRFADDDLIDAVRSGRADLAVAPWPSPPSGVTHVELADDVLVAAVPAASDHAERSAIAPSDLFDESFLTSSYAPRRGFEFHEYFLASGFVPDTVIQIQSLEMLLRLIGRGFGVTIQPSIAVTWNRPHTDVEIVPLAGDPISVTWTATHRDDADTPIVDAAHRIARAFARAVHRGEGSTDQLA